MATETNYVKVPQSNQYDGVSGHSVSTSANSIPSGATTVEGYFFHWTPDGGFIGTGWYSGFSGSPVNVFNEGVYANNDDAFQQYVNGLGENPNLNNVFSQWQQYLEQLESQTTGLGANLISRLVIDIQFKEMSCVTKA
ncbi:hypothetical protein [Thomasclavelia spiroformis]|uniref:hypothetical protein n=1 Tax=Thomasclavelia spiroformis TaxID=29348 RepID=UPI0039966E57